MPALVTEPVSVEPKSLDNLAAKINHEHSAVKAAFRDSVLHAEAAGHLLAQAKGQVRHGKWEAWVEEHTSVSARTAQAYMRLARALPTLEPEKAQRVAELSLRRALEEIAEPSVPCGPKMPAAPDEDIQKHSTTAEIRPEQAQQDTALDVLKATEALIRHIATEGVHSVPHPSASDEVGEVRIPNIGTPEHEATLADAQGEILEPPRDRIKARVQGLAQEEIDRRLDAAIVSSNDVNVLAALRLIENTDPERLARVSNLDETINLEDLVAHLSEAASRAQQ